MKLNVHFINAFTDVIFKGNSAAVIIIDDWLSDSVMQSIATENNLSETAFVKQIGKGKYAIRWFSPITEIDFCGHATLAASYVIFNNIHTCETITFLADAVGELIITKEHDGYIKMDFPIVKAVEITDCPEQILTGLSLPPQNVLLSEQAYFVVYSSEDDVINVKQNNELLKQLAPYDVVVTAMSEQYDFISRYFWPANGGDEDPVTGSIHAGLAPYWAEKLNKSKLTAFQASKRGGQLSCEVKNNRVFISGKAIQYLEGVFTI